MSDQADTLRRLMEERAPAGEEPGEAENDQAGTLRRLMREREARASETPDDRVDSSTH